MPEYPNIEVIEQVRRSLSPPTTVEDLIAKTGLSEAEVSEAIRFLAHDGIAIQARDGRWGLL